MSSLKAATLLGGTALGVLCSPAHGQATVPDIQLVDEFGVNVSSRRNEKLPLAPISVVGTTDESLAILLDFDKHNAILNPRASFQIADNLRIYSDSGQTFGSVNMNGQLQLFKCTANKCVKDYDDGTYISIDMPDNLNATYVSKDGIQWKFKKNQANTSGDFWDHYLDLVTYPDGRSFKLFMESGSLNSYSGTHHIVRPIHILSNTGLLFKYEYESSTVPPYDSSPWLKVSKLTTYNLVDTTCSSNYNICSGSPIASLAISRATTSANQETTTVTDLANRTWVYTSEPRGTLVLTSVRLPGSTTDDLTVTQSWPAPISSVAFRGRQWTYAAPTETTRTRTDPWGQTRTYDFYAGGTLKSVTNELGNTTQILYGLSGGSRTTRTTFPEGNFQTATIDARGNTVSLEISPKPGAGLSSVTRSWSYPATCTNSKICNRPTSFTDELGRVTDFTYDPNHGGLLTVTRPAPVLGGVRPQTRHTYSSLFAWYKDSNGSIVPAPSPIVREVATSQCQTLATCGGTSDEVVTSTEFEIGSSTQASNLRPLATSVGAGDGSLTARSVVTFDAMGNLLTVDGPLPGTADTTMMRYDAARRPVGAVSPDPDGTGALKHRAVRSTYDVKGQVIKLERGTPDTLSDADWASMTVLDQIASTYDPVTGEKVLDVFSAGGTAYAARQYSYDAKGRVECAAERMNPAVYGTLPGACALGASGAFGPDRISKTTYDAADNVLKQQSGIGSSSVIDNVTLTYTANRKLATLTDANGNKTTYEYDGFDHTRKERYPLPDQPGASSDTDYRQQTYDAAGNVTQARLRNGQTISFIYDNLDRPTLKDVPNVVNGELDVATTYDNLDRITSLTTSTDSLTFGYDALSRKTRETSFAGQKSFQYDLAGRLTRLVWPDSDLYIDYDYLSTGEVTKVRENGATAGAGVLAAYTYDTLGRRTAMLRGNGTSTTYGFDAASQMTSLAHDLTSTTSDFVRTFAYNPAAQIITRTTGNDAYAWPGRVSIARRYLANGLNQYEASGALLPTYDARGNLTSAGTVSYAYTSENRLASAGGVALRYDPSGRLNSVTASSTTKFDYVGDSLITERDAGGSVLKRYVPGPGTDEPIVWYEGSGLNDKRWLYADERGSVIAVSDGTGNPVAINSYDEYGIPVTTNLGRFQYTGQAYIPEIGMYYFKARVYSPTLGRFLQTDPIGYSDGAHLYRYALNDPINNSDPTGLAVSGFCGDHKSAPGGFTCTNPNDINNEIVVTGIRSGPHLPQATIMVANVPNFDSYSLLSPIMTAEGLAASAPQSGPKPGDCYSRDSKGGCTQRVGKDGKLELDPEYAKQACDAYHSMMRSNRDVARYTGGTGALNGGRAIVQKGTGWDFLKTPLAFDVVIYAAGLTTYLLSQSEAPPGCSR